MPDDVDRTLARLAVDHGFLTKDEALRYWQQIQAPGSPRFVALLLSSGRLNRADVDRLRALYQQSSGGNAALPPSSAGAVGSSSAVAVAPPPVAAPALPPTMAPARPSTVAAPASTDDGSWEEALAQDRQLAVALLQRGVVTQDRLRECRQLQVQHRLRLGVVLTRKGYADPGVLEEALRALGGGPAAAPTGPPTNPYAMSPPGPVDQDAVPTLNMPPGGLAMGPGGPRGAMTPPRFGPQDAIPTMMGISEASVEELNPFAQPGPPGLGPRATGKKKIDQMYPHPIGAQGMLSGDELNAFEDIPLGPPPSPAASPPAFGAPDAGAPPMDLDAPDDGATLPPAWLQPQPAPSGANPAVETPDSGGERPAAKKKTTALKKPAPASGGGKGLLLFLLLGGLGFVAVVVLAVLKFVLKVF